MTHVDTDVSVRTAVSERKNALSVYRKLNADLILVSYLDPISNNSWYTYLYKLFLDGIFSYFNVSFVEGNVLQPLTLDDLCKVQ